MTNQNTLQQEMNDRKELAELLAETLQGNGIQVWFTPGRLNIRANASISEVRKVLATVNYPAHLVGHNSSYSKSATGEFSTLVKTA